MKWWEHINLLLRNKTAGFFNRLEDQMFYRPCNKVRPNTLLIVKLDSIGDYVLFRNFIASLKTSEKYKSFRITLCGNLWWKDLAEALDGKWIDEFIWLDYPAMNERSYRWSVYKTIRKKAFAVTIHPTYSRDSVSDNVALYSGSPEKIGQEGDLINLNGSLKHRNDGRYTQLVASNTRFCFEFYRNTFFFQALLSTPLEELKPGIEIQSGVTNRILFCPGAKVEWRRWSPQKFAELSQHLKKTFPDSELIICGSEADNKLAEEIRISGSVPFENKCGKLSLVELANLMASARLIVTNDSGPFHIAVALNKKTVCISNGNNYGRFSPYPEELNSSSRVVYPEVLRRIDSEEERLEKFCREGSPLDINTIEVEEVFMSIMKLLAA